MFLTNSSVHPRDHVIKLCDSLQKFMELLRSGLLKNKALIGTDHDKQFHFEMEAGFKQLEAEMNEYIQKLNLDKYDDGSSESGLTEHDENTDDSDISVPLRTRKGRKRNNTALQISPSDLQRRKPDPPPNLPKLPLHKKPPPPPVPPPSDSS